MNRRPVALLLPLALASLALFHGRGSGESPAAAAAPERPVAVGFREWRVDEDGFWGRRLATNRERTLPHALDTCDATGRSTNFARAAGLADGAYEGFHFNDSDVYKVIEAAARELSRQPDPELEARIDRWIAWIAAAQEEDGYLHPFISLHPDEERWRNPHRHELFSIGHLIEAGAVHFQRTGRRDLLEVARRAADRVAEDFRPDGPLPRPPEHQQVEIGLLRLAEVTGEAAYADLAARILEARGRGEGRTLYGEYAQDHLPVAEQREVVGHAVRAMYQYAAMAELSALPDGPDYREALEALWRDLVGRKLYVTGGVGSTVSNEGFGPAFDLPNSSAYSETCAAIGSVMWNQRMFDLTGESRFADLIERTLFNALLSGVSLEGDRFFYPNRLESFRGAARSPWFDCSCCPTNVVRFLPTVPELAHASSADEVWVNQYLAGEARLPVAGAELSLTQETRYPWDGRVRLTLRTERDLDFSLRLRIPDWARGQVADGSLYAFADPAADGSPGFDLAVNGVPVEAALDRGYAVLRRPWRSGDVVELDLPMPVRRVLADERVAANRGRFAIQRGPLVFAAEGLDQPGGSLGERIVEPDSPLEARFDPELLGGMVVVEGSSRPVLLDEDGRQVAGEPEPFRAIPYFAWAHRGATPMQVWIARDPEAARALASPSVASRSEVRASGGSGLEAVNDLLEPAASDDMGIPYFHWWPRQGSTEWIEYVFAEATTVESAEVYWFDDSRRGGGCALPRGWRILHRGDEGWLEVEAREVATTVLDGWSRVSFQPVRTSALRLEVDLPENASVGLYEWRVGEAR